MTRAFICKTCGKGPWDGITVFRLGPKGKQSEWACEAHGGKALDAQTATVIAQLEQVGQSPKKH